ncbi:MAG: beta strand repeat-containing protein, partial [Cyanobium sp.]
GALGTGAVTITNGSTLAANGVALANSFTIGASGGVTTNSTTNSFTAYWNFGTNTGSASATAVSSVGVAFGNVSRGNNNGTTTLLETATPSSGYTGASGQFNAGAAAAGGALTNSSSAFFEFAVTPSAGYQLSLTNLTFGSRSTGTGPALATLLSSLDSYTTALATNALSTASAWQLISPTVAASTLTNGAVTFRIYGSAGTGNTVNVWRIDDLNLAGFSVTNLVTTNAPTGTGTLGISEAGTATFSGNIANSTAATLTAVSGGTATFSGAISGAGSVTKTGLGTVTLSGGSANTFTGTTTVSAGTLQLNKTAGITALSSTNIIVSKVDNDNRATLLLSASGQVADTTAVTLSGGTIRRGGDVSEIFGSLNLTEGSFLDYGADNAVGTLTFAGTYTPSALLTVQNFLPGSKLQFNNSLTSEQLNNPSFFAFSNGFTTGTEGGYFTITAIPEPSTYLAAAGLLSLMLWPSRKRLIKDAKKILGLTAPMRDRLAAKRA